jgi:hypothetical protein
MDNDSDRIKDLESKVSELEDSLEQHKKWLRDGLLNEKKMVADHKAELDSYKAEVDTLAQDKVELVAKDDAGVGLEQDITDAVLAATQLINLPNGWRVVPPEIVVQREDEWQLLDREIQAVMGERVEHYSLGGGHEVSVKVGDDAILITELATYILPLESHEDEDGDVE